MLAKMSKDGGNSTNGHDGYLESWNEYFLNAAVAISRKSKDPNAE